MTTPALPPTPGSAHAIVIGGSIAGLLTARVLSELYTRVTILERDSLEVGAQARKGVPQGRQLHALLKRGEDILVDLFPGITESLLRQGAIQIDFGTDFAWFHFGAWKSRCLPGLKALSLPRPLLEAEVRKRVLALPNVHVIDRVTVRTLLATEGGRRVKGVELESLEDRGERRHLTADLVVDASGRGSQLPHWLEQLGLHRPPETTLEVDVGYATRTFRIPEQTPVKKRGIYILGNAPDSKRLGILTQISEDTWMACASGLLGDHPPTDEAGWMQFMRELPRPDIYEALKGATPLSDIEPYKFKAHLRHHYEKLKDFPDGLAVLGDAHCSFNPIYGQGITTAALSALALRDCLQVARARGALRSPGLSRQLQKTLADVVEVPFRMSTGEDFRFPEVRGKRPFGSAFLLWYTRRVHLAACESPWVVERFYRVMHMLESPAALFHPRILWQVLTKGGATPARARLPETRSIEAT